MLYRLFEAAVSAGFWRPPCEHDGLLEVVRDRILSEWNQNHYICSDLMTYKLCTHRRLRSLPTAVDVAV